MNDYVAQNQLNLRNKFLSLQKVAKGLIVGSCIETDVQKSIDRLDRLIAKYPNDLSLRKSAEELKQRHLNGL